MKRTEKYTKGKTLALAIGVAVSYHEENNVLYELLERHGYWWNGKKKAWEKEATRPSTTIFADKQGEATGVARLRLMCHPDEVSFFLNQLETMANTEVIEVSEKTYPNRHGAGERAYITIRRKD
jgi:hypothetical protein